MSYMNQWLPISVHIKAYMESAKLFALMLSSSSRDPMGGHKRLREQGLRIIEEILNFQRENKNQLPQTANDLIESLDNKAGSIFRSTAAIERPVLSAMIMLGAFGTELTYLLVDKQESIKALSERAFEHLQRSIVADKDYRNKWIKAFDEKTEPACEKLGGVHLLLHGIFAFKAHGEKGRTDLVFQDKITGNRLHPDRFAEGIVLTEWKVSRKAEEAEEKFREARDQAKDYSQGVLGGIDLTSYRYAIVVSKKQVAIPEDLKEGNVIWRHINIAVDPDVPAVASKKRLK